MAHSEGEAEGACRSHWQVEAITGGPTAADIAGAHSRSASSPALLRPARFGMPTLLLSPPLGLAATVANNAWMQDLSQPDREICRERALRQFHSLYRHLARTALIYLLPSVSGLQDQAYVSNLAVALPHRDQDTVVVSRFRSAPRVGEEQVGARFFDLMDVRICRPPAEWQGAPLYLEGEADLKHIRDELYIGAHGMRTSRNALNWAADRFAMTVLPLRIDDPYLYHLDCCLFPITPHNVMLCTAVVDRAELRAIEQRCDIVDVSLEQARSGITNCVLHCGEVLCDSDIHELDAGSAWYPGEKAKIEKLERLCARFGLGIRVFCMSEFYKSGALLSCLIMHVTRAGEGRDGQWSDAS